MEAFFTAYPLLVVAPFTLVMYLSVRQNFRAKGTLGVLNYALWLGVVFPLGWALVLVDRPRQMAGAVAIAAAFGISVLRMASGQTRNPEEGNDGS